MKMKVEADIVLQEELAVVRLRRLAVQVGAAKDQDAQATRVDRVVEMGAAAVLVVTLVVRLSLEIGVAVAFLEAEAVEVAQGSADLAMVEVDQEEEEVEVEVGVHHTVLGVVPISHRLEIRLCKSSCRL